MNAIEDFLSKLARQKLKHAIFNSLDECIAAIKEFHCSSKRQWRPPGPLEHEPDGLGVAWKKRHPKLQELEHHFQSEAQRGHFRSEGVARAEEMAT